MARTTNLEAVAAKRKQILDAAQHLILTKGYEQMSIQDVLEIVQMSSGAFHHYFESRQALLEAFIERMKHQVEQPLLSIIRDPSRSAIEKFQGFLDTLHRLRMAHKADVVKLLQVWYSDTNAVVRLHIDEAVFEQRAPLLTEIAQQGVAEGTFTIAYPDKAGEIILSLLQGMSNAQAKLLLSFPHEHDHQCSITALVATHDAYIDVIERVLGAPVNSFARADVEAVNVWLAALQENASAKETQAQR